MKRRYHLYDDATKQRAIAIAKEYGYYRVEKELRIKSSIVRTWCRKAGVESPYSGINPHPWGKGFVEKRVSDYQVDGCSFKIDPKWYWLTIASEELSEIVRERSWRIEANKGVTPDEIENFFRYNGLRTDLFHLDRFIDQYGIAHIFGARSIINEESFEDFQRLILEKYVEVFTELSSKNRHKYFRIISVKPLDQDH